MLEVYSKGDVCNSGWYELLLPRFLSSLGGDGEGEGCVIQLLSGRDGTVERGRIEAGRLVAMVLMVLLEYIDEDLVGEWATSAVGA